MKTTDDRSKVVEAAATGLQALKGALSGAATRSFISALKAMPVEVGPSLVGGFMRTQGRFAKLSKVARKNLHRAMPELSDEEVNTYIARSWDNVGRTFGEFPVLETMMAKGWITNVNPEQYLRVTGAGKGVLIVVPHTSNWEAGPLAAQSLGVPVHVLYNFNVPPAIDEVIREVRAPRVTGQHLVGQKAAEKLRDLLRAKQPVAAVLDEPLRSGLPVPFFGGTTRAPERAVRIAVQEGANILMVHVERPENNRLRCVFGREFVPDASLDVDQNTRKIVAEMYAEFEKVIRADPGQWIWLNKLWFD